MLGLWLQFILRLEFGFKLYLGLGLESQGKLFVRFKVRIRLGLCFK